MKKALSTVQEALARLKKGGMILLVDDPRRENEGDLFMLAEAATPEKVNFMVTHGRGLVCVAIESAQARRLTLPLMVASHENTETTPGNFRARQGKDHSDARQPALKSKGHHTSGPRLPAHRTRRRLAGAAGPHRSCGDACETRGGASCGRLVRSVAHGRSHGANAGAHAHGGTVRPARRCDTRPHPLHTNTPNLQNDLLIGRARSFREASDGIRYV